MTHVGSGALMLWIDIDPVVVPEADDWYADEHLPDRIEIGGYQRARRFVAVDDDTSPRYLSVFEARTPDALASDGYLGLVSRISAQSTRIRAAFANVARNTFALRAATHRARGGVVAAFRLVATRDADAARIDALVPRLVRGAVVAASWFEPAPDVRARMDAHRVTGRDDASVGPVLLVEAGTPRELGALRAGPLADEAFAAAGYELQAFGLYRLMADFGPAASVPA